MSKDKKILILIFGLLGIYAILTKTSENNELNRYGTLVESEVYYINPTRGSYVVYVTFNYKQKLYKAEFATNHIDSLRKGTKVELLVSKRYPDKYLKLLYVIK